MDQTKLGGTLAKEMFNPQQEATTSRSEIRPLNDLEMELAAGGDGVVCWGDTGP